MSTEKKQHKFTVVRPGTSVHEFDDGKAAVEHLVEHKGHARLYAPDGSLLMTKGVLYEENAETLS